MYQRRWADVLVAAVRVTKETLDEETRELWFAIGGP